MHKLLATNMVRISLALTESLAQDTGLKRLDRNELAEIKHKLMAFIVFMSTAAEKSRKMSRIRYFYYS